MIGESVIRRKCRPGSCDIFNLINSLSHSYVNLVISFSKLALISPSCQDILLLRMDKENLPTRMESISERTF